MQRYQVPGLIYFYVVGGFVTPGTTPKSVVVEVTSDSIDRSILVVTHSSGKDSIVSGLYSVVVEEVGVAVGGVQRHHRWRSIMVSAISDHFSPSVPESSDLPLPPLPPPPPPPPPLLRTTTSDVLPYYHVVGSVYRIFRFYVFTVTTLGFYCV